MIRTLAAFLFLMAVFSVESFADLKEKGSLTFVAFGDSTTAGTPDFRSPSEAPPSGDGNEQSQYAYWMMRRRPEWRVLNRGIAGQRSDEILARFDRDVLANDPYGVIVLAGVNDLYQGFSADFVIKNLTQIYDLSDQARIRAVVCTILPYEGQTARVFEEMKKANDWMRQEARKRGYLFCDTHALLEDPQRKGTLLGTPDGIHPDVEGYRKMGESILNTIENST